MIPLFYIAVHTLANFLCGGPPTVPHVILEYTLRARHPISITDNYNFTIPSNDMYLIVPILK